MIKAQDLEKLYATIANDLKIENFGNEPIINFHNRIIYSAIGKWVMQLFADRDFEEVDINQVSKSHVTISALDVLSSYKKIDDTLAYFFTDDKKFINDIEDIYVNINSIGDKESANKLGKELTSYYKKNLGELSANCRQNFKKDSFYNCSMFWEYRYHQERIKVRTVI